MTLYERKTWYPGSAGGTMIRATDLNDIEAGLETAATEVTDAKDRLDNLVLGDATDVDVSTPPVGGQPLVWHAGTSKWKPGAASVDSNDDVDLDGITDGQVLAWDAGVGKLLPANTSGVSSIDDLSDVDTVTDAPTFGDLLRWDGTNWAPYALTIPTARKQTFAFVKEGVFAAGVGKLRFFNDTTSDFFIWSVRMEVGTAPGAGNVIVDVNVNGTTIFTTQTRRPQGPTTDVATDPNVTVWPAGQFITMDVDSIGTVSPPTDLVVTVVVS